MVDFDIVEKVIDNNTDAKETYLLLTQTGFEEDIEALYYLGITGVRAGNLYFLTKGDVELMHQTIKFISSKTVPLEVIHKNLDLENPRQIINRKIKESYADFFKQQKKECWSHINAKKR